mmetsp:Transcript_15227/g.25770  ORF Transcript_15227/g.25770 Transcript_15227/m.25770 type:complete len:118 (+) Transcript_15227:111-464(+)
MQAQLKAYAQILSQIAAKDQGFAGVIGSIAEGLNELATQKQASIGEKQTQLLSGLHEQSQEFQRRYNNVKQRNESSDKVMQEMKKQLTCYKEEIENMKKMEAHLTVENYQKLVNDFN